MIAAHPQPVALEGRLPAMKLPSVAPELARWTSALENFKDCNVSEATEVWVVTLTALAENRPFISPFLIDSCWQRA